MKKLLFFVAFVSMIFAMSSCNEKTQEQSNAKINVAITLQDPMNKVQQFGDGTTAMDLLILVYEPGATTPKLEENLQFDPVTNTATKEFILAAGQDYDFLFFAYDPSAPYQVDKEARKMVVSYDYDAATDTYSYQGNVEALDAFYAYRTWTVMNNFTANVTLTRMTAQINVGTLTTDYDECFQNWYEPTTLDISLSQVYTEFDFTTGNVAEPVAITFKGGQVADVNEKQFPVAVEENGVKTYPYTYLSVNYILTDGSNINLADINIYDETSAKRRNVQVSNLPVKTNYRTNIFGILLMSVGDVSIVKDPIFTAEEDVEFDQGTETFN